MIYDAVFKVTVIENYCSISLSQRMRWYVPAQPNNANVEIALHIKLLCSQFIEHFIIYKYFVCDSGCEGSNSWRIKTLPVQHTPPTFEINPTQNVNVDWLPFHVSLDNVLARLWQAAQSFRDLNELFGEGTISESRYREWFARFKSGDTSLDGKPGRGSLSDLDDQAFLVAVEGDESLTT
uniref:HTH_48 domain-containing protein n=1 Tax=Glossina austeni TaxID=7395 RepID=A0A1A9UDI2_GLOAU